MTFIKRKLPVISLLTGVFSFITLFIGNHAFAVSDKDLLKEYEKMESVLSVRTGWMYDDIIRKLGWWLIQGLAWVNDWIENVVHKIITLNDFYSSSQVEGLMDLVKPLVFGLFVVAVFVLGFQFMMNKIEKREEVLLNVLMAVTVVVIIPVLMTSMGKVLNIGMNEVEGHSPSLSSSILKSNIVDLKYYAEKDFKTASSRNYGGSNQVPPRPIDKNDSSIGTSDYKFGNILSKDKVAIEINEVLDLTEKEKNGGNKGWGKDEISKKAAKLLKNKSVPTGDGTNEKVAELSGGAIKFTDMGKESYYRYHVNFWIVIFTLIITAFALAITVIKVGRAIFDLAFHQIFGMFVAVTDLTGGQRTKKVLSEMANTFGVLFIMVFILHLFIIYANWVGGLTSSIGSVGVILLLIAGAWAVIDAPDIVQRMMGIDAGLRSGYGALMGAAAATSLASRAGGMVKGMTTGAMSKGAGFAGLMSGMSQGIKGEKNGQPKMPSGGGNPSGGGGNGGKPPSSGDGSGNPSNNPSNNGGEKPLNSSPNDVENKKMKENQKGIPSGEKGKNAKSAMPKGYEQTKSGIIIPSSGGGASGSIGASGSAGSGFDLHGASAKNSASFEQAQTTGFNEDTAIPSSGSPSLETGQHASGTDGGASYGQSQPMERMTGQMEQMQTQMDDMSAQAGGYSSAGGIFTGSNMGRRMSASFQRGRNTGQALGSGVLKRSANRQIKKTRNGGGGMVKSVGRSIGTTTNKTKGTVQSIGQSGFGQSIASMGQSVKSVGSVGQSMSQGVANVGSKVQQAQSAVMTPIGAGIQNIQQRGQQVAGQAGVKIHEIQTNTMQMTDNVIRSVGNATKSGTGKVIGSAKQTVSRVTSGSGASMPKQNIGSKTPTKKPSIKTTKIKEVRNKTIRKQNTIRKKNDIRD